MSPRLIQKFCQTFLQSLLQLKIDFPVLYMALLFGKHKLWNVLLFWRLFGAILILKTEIWKTRGWGTTWTIAPTVVTFHWTVIRNYTINQTINPAPTAIVTFALYLVTLLLCSLLFLFPKDHLWYKWIRKQQSKAFLSPKPCCILTDGPLQHHISATRLV